jgi:hypothetical protein
MQQEAADALLERLRDEEGGFRAPMFCFYMSACVPAYADLPYRILEQSNGFDPRWAQTVREQTLRSHGLSHCMIGRYWSCATHGPPSPGLRTQ